MIAWRGVKRQTALESFTRSTITLQHPSHTSHDLPLYGSI